MNKILLKDFFRSLKKHFARFLSIVSILALGVGFFAGINATEGDMVKSANKYYREKNLMDIKSYNPFGYSDNEIKRIRGMETVSDAEFSYTSDLLLTINDLNYAVKVYSLKKDGLNQNKLTLKEGRLPNKSGEIVIDGGNYVPKGIKVGSNIKLKEQISTNQKENKEPINLNGDSVLKTNDFKVVGIVESPLYVSFERGQTNVGDGKLKAFTYILDEDFNFKNPNNLYIKVSGTSTLDATSQEYKDLVKKVKEDVDAFGKNFMANEVKSAQNKVSDADAELKKNRDERDQKLLDAKKKLDDADKELISGQKKLDEETINGKDQLDDAKKQIAEGEEKYNSGLASYKEGLKKYQTGYDQYLKYKKELDSSKVVLDKAKEELDIGKKKIDDTRLMLEDKKNQLDISSEALKDKETDYKNAVSLKPMLSKGIITLKELSKSLDGKSILTKEEFNLFLLKIKEINPEIYQKVIELTKNQETFDAILIKRVLDNGVKALEEKLLEIDKGIKEYENAQIQIKDGYKQVEEGLIKLKESEKIYNENLEKYNVGLAKYNTGLSSLNASFNTLEESKKKLDSANNTLISSKKELNDAKVKYQSSIETYNTKIAEAKEKLAIGKNDYQKGLAEYEKNKKESEEKLQEADKKILDAKRSLLEIPKSWFVSDREGNPDYSTYFENATRIGKIAKIFPLFFFLVAALVSLTTITRMVEEERLQAGTLKALGYHNRAISMKYLLYALSASILGSSIGLSFGLILFPKLIMNAYNLMYSIPPKVIEFNMFYGLISALIALLTAVSSAYFAVHQEVKETPSNLMMPKAPPAGKKILLERIPFIWNKLSFSRKVTFRNLFRYKKRFIMTLLGIAGCTALIMTGFGIKDSIDGMVNKQFNEINKYNIYTIIDDKKESSKDFDKDLKDINEISEYEKTLQETVSLKEDSSDKEYEVVLVVPENVGNINDFVLLRDSRNGKPINLSENEVTISAKIASVLGLKAGDSFSFKDSDNVIYTSKVTYIAENYINNYIYMGKQAYKNVVSKEPVYNGAFIKVKNSNEEIEKRISDDLLKKEYALTSISARNVENTLNKQLNSLIFVVIVLILSAGALAFIVLYNLSNVNITERMRELATIKVLGFRRRELNQYIFRENFILTLLGSLLGLALGVILHRYIIFSVEVDTMSFVKTIHWKSYIYSILLTFIFSSIVNRISSITLNKINMVESLKSVE